jgi:hypothetical protein
MLPDFLLPESEVQKDGEGPVLSLNDAAGQTLQITLGITELNEQSSLEVLIFGSPDGQTWGAKPISSFSQKFYKGIYTILLDLSDKPDVAHVKAVYKTGRWGHWTTPPVIRCYLFAEPLKV